MPVRSVFAAVLAASVGLAGSSALARQATKPVAASAAAARGIDPARVLAGTSQGFADRTASMTSIMGPTSDSVARMQIPVRPEHPRGMRREADASASLR